MLNDKYIFFLHKLGNGNNLMKSPSSVKLNFIIIIFLSISLQVFAVQSTAEQQSQSSNVTIKSWEYCQGCKELVDIFARSLSDELLITKKKTQSKTVEAGGMIDHFCDREIFAEYQDFVKLTCIKILDEFRVPYLESFQGSVTEATVTNKKEVLAKKQKICIDTVQACKPQNFEYPSSIGTKRNRCAACHVLANDIDMIKRSKNRKLSLKSILEKDEFCDRLGYNHPKYSWLETLCEEIMEEKIDVIAFHDQVARTGFAPSQTMPEMLCEEFYGCTKDMKEDKTKIKTFKKKSNKKHKGL